MNLTTDGINLIVAIQSLGGWLQTPMQFFTFLGSENFFFLVLPLIYWSVDARLGLRVALILITSNSLNSIFKLAFASPRPYWVSTQVNPLTAETSFGIPSGHAQNSVAIWGTMADGIRKQWAWAAALLLAFLVGLSRLYLGVHFALDVLAGWLIGGILLLAFISLWGPVSAWIAKKTMGQQIAMAFFVSLIMIALGAWEVARLDGYVIPQEWIDNALRTGIEPDPISLAGFITSAGTLFGLAVGMAWIVSKGGYSASGPAEKRALRYVIGLVGILILWMGLGEIFPRDENMLSYILRYFRYTLVGLWIAAGAPWLFFRFRLADKPKM